MFIILKITECGGSFTEERERAFLHDLKRLKLMLILKQILRFSCTYMELGAKHLR